LSVWNCSSSFLVRLRRYLCGSKQLIAYIKLLKVLLKRNAAIATITNHLLYEYYTSCVVRLESPPRTSRSPHRNPRKAENAMRRSNNHQRRSSGPIGPRIVPETTFRGSSGNIRAGRSATCAPSCGKAPTRRRIGA